MSNLTPHTELVIEFLDSIIGERVDYSIPVISDSNIFAIANKVSKEQCTRIKKRVFPKKHLKNNACSYFTEDGSSISCWVETIDDNNQISLWISRNTRTPRRVN